MLAHGLNQQRQVTLQQHNVFSQPPIPQRAYYHVLRTAHSGGIQAQSRRRSAGTGRHGRHGASSNVSAGHNAYTNTSASRNRSRSSGLIWTTAHACTDITKQQASHSINYIGPGPGVCSMHASELNISSTLGSRALQNSADASKVQSGNPQNKCLNFEVSGGRVVTLRLPPGPTRNTGRAVRRMAPRLHRLQRLHAAGACTAPCMQAHKLQARARARVVQAQRFQQSCSCRTKQAPARGQQVRETRQPNSHVRRRTTAHMRHCQQ